MASMMRVSKFLLMCGALLAPLAAQADTNYPTRPITIIVPFPTGGSTDPFARLIGQKLSDSVGQSVIIDNRPGANALIGTEVARRAPADGYTLLFTASTHVINPLLMPEIPYGPKDFEPVSLLVRSDFVMVTHPSVPAKTLKDFIAYASKNPGKLNYATSGPGNPNHLAGEHFKRLTGIDMMDVPYKGGGPAINDLIGGQVDVMFSVPTSVAAHIQNGRLNALAYTGDKPFLGLRIPSFEQAGLPGFSINSWNGILVPAGTPKPIIEKLSAEIKKILETQEVKTMLAAQGQEPWYKGPADFAAMLQSDHEKYGSIIKTANIKIK